MLQNNIEPFVFIVGDFVPGSQWLCVSQLLVEMQHAALEVNAVSYATALMDAWTASNNRWWFVVKFFKKVPFGLNGSSNTFHEARPTIACSPLAETSASHRKFVFFLKHGEYVCRNAGFVTQMGI